MLARCLWRTLAAFLFLVEILLAKPYLENKPLALRIPGVNLHIVLQNSIALHYGIVGLAAIIFSILGACSIAAFIEKRLFETEDEE